VKIDPFVPDKILYHPDRIAEWLESGDTRPISWELDVSNKCDHKCPDCNGGWKETGKGLLDLDTAKNYVYQIKELGGKSIVLTGGGEPLLNPAIAKVMEYANYSKGMDVSLITNGSHIWNFFKDIIKYCTWVRVSLDAASPEVYKFTHGCSKAIFEKVIAGISLLVEEKKLQKGGDNNCTIGVAFLTHRKTKQEMLAFTKLCKSLGVDYVQFRPYHYDNCYITRELKECEKETVPGKFYVLKSGNKYNHLFDKEIPYKKCYGHHFCGVINLHKVYLCCHFRRKEKYELGDLREKRLYEIWDSEKRKEVYQNIDYSDCYPVCRCDRLNRILWKLKEEPATHINFV